MDCSYFTLQAVARARVGVGGVRCRDGVAARDAIAGRIEAQDHGVAARIGGRRQPRQAVVAEGQAPAGVHTVGDRRDPVRGVEAIGHAQAPAGPFRP